MRKAQVKWMLYREQFCFIYLYNFLTMFILSLTISKLFQLSIYYINLDQYIWLFAIYLLAKTSKPKITQMKTFNQTLILFLFMLAL